MESPQLQNSLSTGVAQPIRILLVDDNPRFLTLAAAMLRVKPRVDIVGLALSGRETLTQIARLQPDLVLMDVAMPDINGLILTRHLKRRPDAPRIILMTIYDDPEYRRAAELANADGFVSKAELGLALWPIISALFS